MDQVVEDGVVAAPSPATSPLYAGPVICAPGREAGFLATVGLEGSLKVVSSGVAGTICLALLSD